MVLSRWRWLERYGKRGRAEERSRGDAVVGSRHLLRGRPTRHAFSAASGIDNRGAAVTSVSAPLLAACVVLSVRSGKKKPVLQGCVRFSRTKT
jgi:hypothetical protein